MAADRTSNNLFGNALIGLITPVPGKVNLSLSWTLIGQKQP